MNGGILDTPQPKIKIFSVVCFFFLLFFTLAWHSHHHHRRRFFSFPFFIFLFTVFRRKLLCDDDIEHKNRPHRYYLNIIPGFMVAKKSFYWNLLTKTKMAYLMFIVFIFDVGFDMRTWTSRQRQTERGKHGQNAIWFGFRWSVISMIDSMTMSLVFTRLFILLLLLLFLHFPSQSWQCTIIYCNF